MFFQLRKGFDQTLKKKNTLQKNILVEVLQIKKKKKKKIKSGKKKKKKIDLLRCVGVTIFWCC